MTVSVDFFHSVIAALAARAAHLGHYNKPTGAQMEMARVEGWIGLPSSELQVLIIEPKN
jgi:hypothetical protein